MKFAFIFPGQGSQYIGMLKELAIKYPLIKDTFCEASNLLDYDLWDLIQQGPIEELNKTWKTQPALLASSVAIYRTWLTQKGNKPSFMAGHSLGEYSALVCADVLNFCDAIKLVELRGKLMQEAVPEGVGAMKVIIGLDYNIIYNICKDVAKEQIVSPVNINSPKQIVIAGHKEAVERAGKACKGAGARILPLLISVPSHCELMKVASEKFSKKLNCINFNKPSIPVVNNINVRCEVSPNKIREALVHQLYSPVRWNEVMQFMASQNVKYFFEIGPRKVLTNLTKQILSNLNAAAINDIMSLTTALKNK